MYPKIDDVERVHEKDTKVILYVNKQAKTIAHQSDIVRFCRLSKFISSITHQITLILPLYLIISTIFHIKENFFVVSWWLTSSNAFQMRVIVTVECVIVTSSMPR